MPAVAVAQAVDAKHLAALLIVHAGANGLEIEIADAVTVGNDVILRNVEIETEPKETKFAEVRLEDVRPLPRGGYMIGRLSVPAMQQSGPGGTWSIGALTFANILLPPQEDKAAPALYTERFEMEASRLTTEKGAVIADVGPIRWIGQPYAPGRDMTSRLEPFAITIDKGLLGAQVGVDTDSGTVDTLRAIGGAKVKAEISGTSTWRDTDGRTTFATAVDIGDVGKLSFNIGLTGMTSDMLREVGKLGAGGSQSGLAALSAFGQSLKLDAFAVRFDDASYTLKAIDEGAKKANQTRAQYVAQLKAAAPMLLAALQDPKLSQQAAAAVSAYLDNPKSLEIGLKPPKGVTFLDLGLAAMTAPQTIARRLNVQVTANK